MINPDHNRIDTLFKQTFFSFKHKDFVFLWFGMFLIMTGGQMHQTARGMLVYTMTESPTILGSITFAEAIAMLIFGLFGGAIADVLNRKTVVLVGQFVTMGLAVVITVFAIIDYLYWYHLLLAAIIQGAFWALTIPARQAMIPGIVGEQNLGNAMAIVGAGTSAAVLMGPIVGGILYGAVGPKGVYLIISIISLSGFISTSFIHRPADTETNLDTKKLVKQMLNGLVYAWKVKDVFVILFVGFLIGLLTNPLRVFLPVLVVDTYQKKSEMLGLFVSTLGLSSLIGSLSLAVIGNWRRGLIFIISGIVCGFTVVFTVSMPVYWLALLLLLFFGLGEAGQRVLSQSLLMGRVSDSYRGRIMSLQEMKLGMMFLGALPAGFLAEFLGVEPTLKILGSSAVIVSTAVLVKGRNLRRIM
tara:strand:- start:939 stop:2180 length:1242 start_codon:yes stop_codon:yes gene_type:complete